MPGILGAGDIDAMIADLDAAGGAVEVTVGATTVTGLFDRAAVQMFDGEMPTLVADGESVHVRGGTLPEIEPGAAITVDGVAYKVLRILAYGDGAMVRIALSKTT